MCTGVLFAHRIRWLVGTACMVGLAGCENPFGPPAEPVVFALASIAGVPVDSTVDFLPMCMPTLAAEGRHLRFLGDTIRFHQSGRMVHDTYQRSGTGNYVGADTSRYLRVGLEVLFFRHEYSGRFRIEDDGLLLREGWCGAWWYARVAAPAP